MADISLQKFIHKMKKLFAANIFTTGYFQFMKRNFYHAFNLLQPANLTAMHNAHAYTGIAGAACPSAAVCIHFNIIGQFKINDVRNIFYVDATRSNICCN